MTEFKFEDLNKKTVAQLRKIAEGVEHEALQDAAKMPKRELLAALCQALGIEAGEAPEESAPEQEPAVPEDTEETAGEPAPDTPPEASAKKEKPSVQESAAADEKVEEKEPAAPESETSEKATKPPEESPKEKAAAAQEEDAAEPAADDAENEKPAAKEDAKKKKAAAEEAPPQESPPVANMEKSKFKLQIRELKSQRDAALETHDHVQLKAIRRRIRTLKRKVRSMAI